MKRKLALVALLSMTGAAVMMPTLVQASHGCCKKKCCKKKCCKKTCCGTNSTSSSCCS